MAYLGQWLGHVGLVLFSTRSLDFTPFDLFPKGQSEGMGVSKHSDDTNGCSSACCVYYNGHRTRATWSIIHSTKPSSICTVDTLNICRNKYLQILLLMCPIRL
ncbi:hypothetical protein TNCV_1139741 [Trichonephila clavipes]|nr:hypothetical protein TNCV_1139741 [Trichonephila clavipes]